MRIVNVFLAIGAFLIAHPAHAGGSDSCVLSDTKVVCRIKLTVSGNGDDRPCTVTVPPFPVARNGSEQQPTVLIFFFHGHPNLSFSPNGVQISPGSNGTDPSQAFDTVGPAGRHAFIIVDKNPSNEDFPYQVSILNTVTNKSCTSADPFITNQN